LSAVVLESILVSQYSPPTTERRPCVGLVCWFVGGCLWAGSDYWNGNGDRDIFHTISRAYEQRNVPFYLALPDDHGYPQQDAAVKSFLNNTDKVVPLPMWRLLYGAPDPTLADVQVEESLVTPVNKARENLQAYLMEEEPTSATTFNEILNKRAKELQTVVGVALRLYVGTSVFFSFFHFVLPPVIPMPFCMNVCF